MRERKVNERSLSNVNMDRWKEIGWTLCFVLITLSTNAWGQKDRLPKIAIVGGGIGGASTAYFMRELFGKSATIDVYEKAEVGGRLATVKIGGRHYESGGSAIHPGNAYMVNFTRLLGLNRESVSVGHLSLYDGREMLFDGSQWSLITLAQLMWRYGWNMIRLNKYIKNLLYKFERIYGHQGRGLAFSTPERLMESMDGELMSYLHYSLDEVLSHDGFSQQFIKEFASGIMRNNYGQTQSSQAFVGSVSLAGIEDGMWCVSEGNKKIPQRLLKRANVNLIKSKVSAISIHPTEHFTRYELVSDVHKNIYDIVILAAPLHDGIADISFVGFNESITEFPDHYHRTVATFVRGLPHFTKFGYQTLHQFPDIVLSTNNKVFFNSLGKIHPIHKYASTYKDKQELSVWKVFSQRHLTENEMNELFVSHEEVRVVDWKAAYPHYSSSQVNLPSFRLANQLYYVNAIELAASAMEMLAIGGRNVALLAHNEWFDKDGLVDPYVDGQFGREEL